MSQHQFFRRTAVPAQAAQQMETRTIPAPIRGLILNENETFMQAGAAVICDNWRPTTRGASLRGGFERWSDLHAPTATPWANSHAYAISDTAADGVTVYACMVAHSSPAGPTSFATYRAANPTHWAEVPAPALTDPAREAIISGFSYVSGNNARMYAGQSTVLYDVTDAIPVVIKTGQSSGNYCASQLANDGGDWLMVVNDAGDFPMRFDGTAWTTLNGGEITATGVYSAAVATGQNLVYVCKYRNRYFFVEKDSMTAWYLPLNAVGGILKPIPLSGAASEGGKLLFCATWSIDAGDGIDDKLVFCTNLGELIIFTGSDPDLAASWRQEGRYNMSKPLGMNAHISVGGDLLIATVDGILPTSGAITKDRAELELMAITRQINPMWRTEVLDKHEYSWTMCKWGEYNGIFVTLPGGLPNARRCLVANASTGAWSRYTGWDAMCWMMMGSDMFFGTQSGVVMKADQGGYDDGLPYVCTLVGGWEMFQSPAQTITWRQARASFTARGSQPFQPQLSATTDYVVTLPTPPAAGPDPGLLDVWGEGLWGEALWGVGAPPPAVKNTGWVSIGMTGFSHAPIVQVTVAQAGKPAVDLISIAATFERAGVNV